MQAIPFPLLLVATERIVTVVAAAVTALSSQLSAGVVGPNLGLRSAALTGAGALLAASGISTLLREWQVLWRETQASSARVRRA